MKGDIPAAIGLDHLDVCRGEFGLAGQEMAHNPGPPPERDDRRMLHDEQSLNATSDHLGVANFLMRPRPAIIHPAEVFDLKTMQNVGRFHTQMLRRVV